MKTWLKLDEWIYDNGWCDDSGGVYVHRPGWCHPKLIFDMWMLIKKASRGPGTRLVSDLTFLQFPTATFNACPVSYIQSDVHITFIQKLIFHKRLRLNWGTTLVYFYELPDDWWWWSLRYIKYYVHGQKIQMLTLPALTFIISTKMKLLLVFNRTGRNQERL